MAPFTTATLPLHSCRMFASLHFLGCRQTVHRDRARLRTAVETNAAAGAVVSGVARGMHAVGTQAGIQFQALGRTAVHAKSATFTFVNVDGDLTACLSCHVHLPGAACATCGRCNHFVFS